VDEERPRRSALVNALWGSGLDCGPASDDVLNRMRRVGLCFTLGVAASVGIVVGLLDSAGWGATAAVISLLALGLTFRAAISNYDRRAG